MENFSDRNCCSLLGCWLNKLIAFGHSPSTGLDSCVTIFLPHLFIGFLGCFPQVIFCTNDWVNVVWFSAHIKCACDLALVKVGIGVKCHRMNSMTSFEKEDMAGKMNGCKEDSDKFDDIIWKGRYGGKKWVGVRIKPQEKWKCGKTWCFTLNAKTSKMSRTSEIHNSITIIHSITKNDRVKIGRAHVWTPVTWA